LLEPTQHFEGAFFAQSQSCDPDQAVEDILGAFEGQELAGVLFFASSRCDFKHFAATLHHRLGVPTVGCTTSGEVSGSGGHSEHSVVALGFCKSGFEIETLLIPDVGSRSTDNIADAVEHAPQVRTDYSFGLMLIDGLSMAEERFCAGLTRALQDTPIIGGSAGDDLRFEQTWVACNGRVERDAAALMLVNTALPVSIFHSHHFTATDTRLVITGAIPEERRVTEINGEPAAAGYARAVGLDVRELSPMIFAEHPVVLSIGGEYYVRSIQQANPDGSLTFFCAIDEGLVLRIAEGGDLPARFRSVINEQREKVGELGLMIGFDCILRRIELLNHQQLDEVGEILSQAPFIGFSTYGEQINGLHVNQTMTGVAIGRAA
jgi:hypothetical protein